MMDWSRGTNVVRGLVPIGPVLLSLARPMVERRLRTGRTPYSHSSTDPKGRGWLGDRADETSNGRLKLGQSHPNRPGPTRSRGTAARRQNAETPLSRSRTRDGANASAPSPPRSLLLAQTPTLPTAPPPRVRR